MTGRHLGERIHDLLDNRLPRDAAAEAMAHLAACDECSLRWRELRAAREALHSSEAGIDTRFAQQLLDREHMAQIARRESPREARAARGRDRRPVTLSLSLTLLLVALMGAAYVAGEPADVDPELAASASDGLSTVQVDSATMREGEELDGWVYPDWATSQLAPVTAVERELPDGSPVMLAWLIADGATVTIAETRGRLLTERLADVPRAAVDGLDVYVVETSPARIAWQSGECVVILECDCALGTLESVAAQFPRDVDHDAFDQILAGLGVFKDALTGH